MLEEKNKTQLSIMFFHLFSFEKVWDLTFNVYILFWVFFNLLISNLIHSLPFRRVWSILSVNIVCFLWRISHDNQPQRRAAPFDRPSVLPGWAVFRPFSDGGKYIGRVLRVYTGIWQRRGGSGVLLCSLRSGLRCRNAACASFALLQNRLFMRGPYSIIYFNKCQ